MSTFEKHAFPVSELSGQGQMELTDPGMTLRDYFAAQAIPAAWEQERETKTTGYAGIAQRCYYLADAMLKAREQS